MLLDLLLLLDPRYCKICCCECSSLERHRSLGHGQTPGFVCTRMQLDISINGAHSVQSADSSHFLFSEANRKMNEITGISQGRVRCIFGQSDSALRTFRAVRQTLSQSTGNLSRALST